MKIPQITIKIELFIIFLLCIVMPVGVVAYIYYRQTVKVMIDQNIAWQINSLNQGEESLEFRVNIINNLFSATISNSLVMDIVSNQNVPAVWTSEDIKRLQQFIIGTETNSDIIKMRLYTDKPIYSVDSKTYSSLKSFQATEIYKVMSGYKERIYFSEKYIYTGEESRGSSVVSCFIGVKYLNDFVDDALVIEFVLKEDYFMDVLRSLTGEIEGTAFLVNEDGSIKMNSGKNTQDCAEIVRNIFETEDKNPVDWERIVYNNNRYYLGARQIAQTKWHLFFILDEVELLKETEPLSQQLFVVLFISLSVLTVFLFMLSNLITIRIKRLRNAMKRLQSGDFNISLKITGNDEISDLTHDFLAMVKTTDELLKDKTLTLEKLRSLELKALHSQINPHFLYNSLDLINWQAFERDVPEIQETVNELAKFYKISLSKGETSITLADELVHAQLYINIQNRRFDNIIEFQCTVAEELQRYYIPKITLQPIVENAIMHGILNKPEKRGKICIWAEQTNEYLYIWVSDDGIGIRDENKEIIFNKDLGAGYGLSNVDNRLKIYYGKDCGLSLIPTNIGTTVLITIRPSHSNGLMRT